jgi:phenylalanyl-tRNA synthetase beta chain
VLKTLNIFTEKLLTKKRIKSEQFSYGLEILFEDKCVAKLGNLNKNILKKTSIEQPVFYAELDFTQLIKARTSSLKSQEIAKFPEVRRDLSLVLDKKITFEDIRNIVEDKSLGGILKNINVFDYYVGENIEKDKKAYALSFILQDEKKTLNDKTIDRLMNKLMERFKRELGAVIRM